jgi:hypothetical protein
VEWMCHVVSHDLALSDIGIKMSKRIPEISFPIDTLRVVLMRDFLTSPLGLCHRYANYPVSCLVLHIPNN